MSSSSLKTSSSNHFTNSSSVGRTWKPSMLRQAVFSLTSRLALGRKERGWMALAWLPLPPWPPAAGRGWLPECPLPLQSLLSLLLPSLLLLLFFLHCQLLPLGLLQVDLGPGLGTPGRFLSPASTSTLHHLLQEAWQLFTAGTSRHL